MSYPDARYLGDHGEVNAVYRPAGREPDLIVGGHTTYSYLATGDGTHGDFGLYRVEMAPDAKGPGPHFHRTMSESFFVLGGKVRLYDGARWVDAATGDFLYVPEGGVHGFTNASGEPASMLLLFAPAGPREAYFEALREVAAGRLRFTEEEWRAFCRSHDSYFI